MTIVFSDLHLGKVPADDASRLRELGDCIRHFRDERALERVIFLGDTFDAFIEYPNHIPYPVIQWISLARELQKEGLVIEYFAGNHDRWHLGYIEKELNLKIHRDPLVRSIEGKKVWLEHGDCVEEHRGLVGFLKSFSSKPWVYFLYRTFLPFGLGQHVAAWVSKTFSGFTIKPKTVAALKSYALQKLAQNECEVIIMGHCHEASMDTMNPPVACSPSVGIYVNAGNWHHSRSFILLSDQIALCKWSNSEFSTLRESIF